MKISWLLKNITQIYEIKKKNQTQNLSIVSTTTDHSKGYYEKKQRGSLFQYFVCSTFYNFLANQAIQNV